MHFRPERVTCKCGQLTGTYRMIANPTKTAVLVRSAWTLSGEFTMLRIKGDIILSTTVPYCAVCGEGVQSE
jgi:hypothetical protein